jgi:alkanesulfonate monooxygenase SsuD/methylene tetrahydromethanopterin reductase-like flavin-dependent oxidoreductase (luciferase family)
VKVGVILPSREWPGEPAPRYADVRGLARQAESLGFDSVWLFDHLLVREPGRPDQGFWETWTLLSALAEATTRVEVGTLVASAGFRHPGVLAKMAETLDEVSGGRLVLGLGAGWLQAELDAFGLPHDRPVSRLEEALQVIGPLLRGGRVDFTGRFFNATACVNVPRGPRAQGPPILLGGQGPRMLRLAARFADAWNACWFAGPDARWHGLRRALDAACEAEGRDPATLQATAGVPVLYPELGATVPSGQARAQVLVGNTAAVAAALGDLADAGVAHVMCSVKPTTPAALDRLGEVLRRYRSA